MADICTVCHDPLQESNNMTPIALTIHPQTLTDLRLYIKQALGLQRLPRESGVNVFLYLALLFRNDRNKLYRSMVDHINSDLEEDREQGDRANDGSLRDQLDRANDSTLRDQLDEQLAPAVRPCTTHLQEKMGIPTRHYKPYLDAFCVFDKEWQYKHTHKSRDLLAWTPLAEKHLAAWADRIPVEWEKAFWKCLGFRVSTENLGPAAQSVQPFYISTPRSPYRNYHPSQSHKKAKKRQDYKGCIDVDIRACFPAIFWWELGGKDCDWAQVMDPRTDRSRKSFIKLIMDSFGCSEREAKKRRSSLFMEYRNNHRYSSGCDWFDELHGRILDHVAAQHPGESMHIIYTRYEKVIRDKMATCGEVELDMHDGLIYSQVDLRAARRIVRPYQLSADPW